MRMANCFKAQQLLLAIRQHVYHTHETSSIRLLPVHLAFLLQSIYLLRNLILPQSRGIENDKRPNTQQYPRRPTCPQCAAQIRNRLAIIYRRWHEVVREARDQAAIFGRPEEVVAVIDGFETQDVHGREVD